MGRTGDCGKQSELLSGKYIFITISQMKHFRARERRSCNSWGTGVTLPLLYEAVQGRQDLYVTLTPKDAPSPRCPGPTVAPTAIHTEPHTPMFASGHRPFGEIELKTKSPNPESLSIKVEEKANSFIIKLALNQNVMCITGKLLKRWQRQRNLSLLYSQAGATHHIHVLKIKVRIFLYLYAGRWVVQF